VCAVDICDDEEDVTEECVVDPGKEVDADDGVDVEDEAPTEDMLGGTMGEVDKEDVSAVPENENALEDVETG
jgi:hypothetical protein